MILELKELFLPARVHVLHFLRSPICDSVSTHCPTTAISLGNGTEEARVKAGDFANENGRFDVQGESIGNSGGMEAEQIRSVYRLSSLRDVSLLNRTATTMAHK